MDMWDNNPILGLIFYSLFINSSLKVKERSYKPVLRPLMVLHA